MWAVSLLWVLRKYIDSISQREEEAKQRRQREAWPADLSPDDTDIVIEDQPDKASERFRCRLCGHESADGAYCPDCLAPTMEKLLPDG